MRRRRKVEKKLEVIFVPAEELGDNPYHPYARLTPQERRARVIAILAKAYREVLAEEEAGEKKRRAA